MSRLLKIVLPIGILVVAGAAAFAIFRLKPEPETRRPIIPPPIVRVVEARTDEVRLTVHSQGTVAPRTESQVVPEVSGRVLRVADTFVAGGFFEEGDVLLEIDPYDYRQAAVRARAQVAQAKLRLAREEAEASVARREWEELGEGDGSPLTLRVPQIEDARAALAAAEAALEQAERDLERTTIRAPYAGRVRSKQVDIGQYVNRGTPVGSIYAIDFAEVRLPLPDRDLAYLEGLPLVYRGDGAGDVGPEVVLTADFAGERRSWRGRIVRTEGEIDPRTRMVHVIARVRDPYAPASEGRPPLAVGMFVRAEILGRRVDDVTILPREALRGEDRVWIVDGDRRLRFRPVEVLRTERDRVLLRSGVEAGERVCLSAMEAVTDGMEVRVYGEDTDGAPPPDEPDRSAVAGETAA